MLLYHVRTLEKATRNQDEKKKITKQNHQELPAA